MVLQGKTTLSASVILTTCIATVANTGAGLGAGVYVAHYTCPGCSAVSGGTTLGEQWKALHQSFLLFGLCSAVASLEAYHFCLETSKTLRLLNATSLNPKP